MRILIADDDVVLRHALRVHLERWGYDVIESPDGASAWNALREPPAPPLAIMDWNMPGVDGPALCQEVRETPALSGMYIILLTSNASKKDMITGLESGADDYIVKPFGSEELLARIRVALRHVFASDTPAGRVEHAGLTIDYDLHRVSCDGRPVHLSPKEYELLTLLSRSEGRVLTHRAILRALWGPHAIDRTEHLWTLVRHLRRKIEPNPDAPVYLLTEYGVGYRFGHA